MNRYPKGKALLSLALAFVILFGEIGMLSQKVFAQEMSFKPTQEAYGNTEEIPESAEEKNQPLITEENGGGVTDINEINTNDINTNDTNIMEKEAIDTINGDGKASESGEVPEEGTLPEKTISEVQAAAQDTKWKEAIGAFNEILADHDLIAALYNKTTYEVREKPSVDSPVVKTIRIGHPVNLLAVEILENKVWYQVDFAVDDILYSGYIENENIITSDSDFREWKKAYGIDKILGGKLISGRSLGTLLYSFPESYQPYILALASAHPNWTFIPFETELNWDTVIANEMYPARNLVPMNSLDSYKSTDPQFYNAATGTWIPQDSGNWAQASEAAVRYYMDPRNFLNEESVFQFELLTYSTDYTESGVEAILNGTFMSKKVLEDNSSNGKTYGNVFMELGKSQKVSPYFLASRIRQEQGVSGSELISGKYPGYEGLYNYFNIGATGNNLKEVIINGLKEARNSGWTSRYLSLAGGTARVADKYIKRGQDTLYLQKFDVDRSYDGLYWHQYMQNLLAADSEGKTVKKAYAAMGVLDNNYVFKVPVYENMPSIASEKPKESEKPIESDKPIENETPIESLVQPILKLGKNSLSSITLNWSGVSGADGYKIYRSESETGNYGLVGTVYTGNTSYSEKVVPGKTYYYRVQAYNGALKPSDSNILKVSTKLNTPTISSVSSKSFSQADLKWGQVAGISGYQIYRKTGAKGTYKALKSVKGSASVSFSDKTLLPNGRYYYKIRTYYTVDGKDYYSSFSKEVSVSTSMKAVTLSSVKARSKTSAVATWKKSSSVSGYEIYRKTKTGSYKRIKVLKGANKLSYVDKGLKSKQTYYYKVRAYKTVGGKNYYSPYSKQIKLVTK